MLVLAAAACSAPQATGHPPDADPTAQSDAELLGHEAFQLLDQAAGYRSSHRDRLPATVAALGLDSLTPDMVLRLSARNDSSLARIAFRRPDGHALAWCEASVEALEQASLGAGAFGVWCASTAGATDSFTVGGTP